MDDRGDFEDINRGLVVEIDKTLTPDGEVVFDFAECTRLSDGGYGPTTDHADRIQRTSTVNHGHQR
jgi:hypothetical protein